MKQKRKTRFSLAFLLLLFIPAAFFAIWIKTQLERKPAAWEYFQEQQIGKVQTRLDELNDAKKNHLLFVDFAWSVESKMLEKRMQAMEVDQLFQDKNVVLLRYSIENSKYMDDQFKSLLKRCGLTRYSFKKGYLTYFSGDGKNPPKVIDSDYAMRKNFVKEIVTILESKN